MKLTASTLFLCLLFVSIAKASPCEIFQAVSRRKLAVIESNQLRPIGHMPVMEYSAESGLILGVFNQQIARVGLYDGQVALLDAVSRSPIARLKANMALDWVSRSKIVVGKNCTAQQMAMAVVFAMTADSRGNFKSAASFCGEALSNK